MDSLGGSRWGLKPVGVITGIRGQGRGVGEDGSIVAR